MKRALIAISVGLGMTVSAQTPPPAVLGKVTQVEGVVTVSSGATVTLAAPGTVITEGNRFVTASSGAARLTMDNGCVIRLKPNESLMIDSRKNCDGLIAAIQAVSDSQAAAAVLGGTSVSPVALIAGGALLLSLAGGSGSGPAPGAGPGPGEGSVIPVPPISGQ